jgi:anthranilate phosphoribosyltransferase
MTYDEVKAAVSEMLSGDMSTPETVLILKRIETEGVGAEQIAAGVEVMRQNMIQVYVPDGAIDIVGTGGTGLKTLSISTATAIVVAACGVPVAKHGNRGASSPTGTADTLSELGVNIAMTPERASAAVSEIGLGFLYAPTYHPAMRHVAEARKRIGKRTLFNRLGPLCNPGSVKNMLLGVAVREELEPIANALARDPDMNALVVRGRDGLDEITLTDVTDIVMVENGETQVGELDATGLINPPATLDDIRGGEPKYNANALRDLLNGHASAYQEIVLLNASEALQLADPDLAEGQGYVRAIEAIESGKARRKLQELVKYSNG